jgi:hypothetical protein
MIGIDVEKPFWPDRVSVDVEAILGDPTIRQASGLRVVIAWDDPNNEGAERGAEFFISELMLTGPKEAE